MKSFPCAIRMFWLFAMLSFAASAQATQVSGFQAEYAVGNWTVSGFNLPAVDTSGAPASITMYEPDIDNLTNHGYHQTAFTINAAGSGTFSFNWAMTTNDQCCSGLDVMNITQQLLFGGNGCTGGWAGCTVSSTSGSYSAPVNAGDLIGFVAWSQDACCGPDVWTISNFSAPGSSVPEPSSLALLSFGIAGLGFSRRSKDKQAA